MGSANERRRYSVTSSLIGWAHTMDYPRGRIVSTCTIRVLNVRRQAITWSNVDVLSIGSWGSVTFVWKYKFFLSWKYVWNCLCTFRPQCVNACITICRNHFVVYAPSQWETTLQCNIVSHWLGTCTKWSQAHLSVVLTVRPIQLRYVQISRSYLADINVKHYSYTSALFYSSVSNPLTA